MNRLAAFTFGTAAAALAALGADKIDFKRQVRPILEVSCLSCHGAEKPKGKLNLLTRADALKGGEDGPALVPGDPAKSPLYTTTTLPADHDDVMPPKGDKLTRAQQETLRQWIAEGAAWPDDVRLVQRKKIDFVRDIQPVFEFQCVACHREGHDKGDLRMDVAAEFFKSAFIVPGDALASKVYTTTILAKDDDDLMPPAKKGGPLPPEKTDLIREWIDQGALWPEGLVLQPRKAEEAGPQDEGALLAGIHAALVKNSTVTQAADMKPYSEDLPWAGLKFDLVVIPGGEFEMGGAAGDDQAQADEKPVRPVKIEPFWMGRTEVSWDEYEQFMYREIEFAAVRAGTENPYLN
ncbi:MAG: c-type cytochrome domain-containing protein, partial [Verrucomicrobiota bacterium]